jgi:hypothetical protein
MLNISIFAGQVSIGRQKSEVSGFGSSNAIHAIPFIISVDLLAKRKKTCYNFGYDDKPNKKHTIFSR